MRAKTKKWFSPLFVLTLAVAGIFGVSAAVVDKQAEETQVVEKADAANERTIYLNPGVWDKDNAWFGIWKHNTNTFAQFSSVTVYNGGTAKTYYKATVDSATNSCNFVRFHAGGSMEWSNVDNQTSDCSIEDNTLCVITGWNQGDRTVSNHVYTVTKTASVNKTLEDTGNKLEINESLLVSSESNFPVPGNASDKSGYTKTSGWYTNLACTNSYTSRTLSSDITLYTKYTSVDYTEGTRYYLDITKNCSKWESDSAWFAVYLYSPLDRNANWARLTRLGDSHTYYFDMPSGTWNKLLWIRLNPSCDVTKLPTYESKYGFWNQSNDVFKDSSKEYWLVTSDTWNNIPGTWYNSTDGQYRIFSTPLSPSISTMRYWFTFRTPGNLFENGGRFAIHAYNDSEDYYFTTSSIQNSASGDTHYFYYVDLPTTITKIQPIRIESGSSNAGRISVWNWMANDDKYLAVSSYKPSVMWVCDYYNWDTPAYSCGFYAFANSTLSPAWTASAPVMAKVLEAYYTCSDSDLNGNRAASNLKSNFWEHLYGTGFDTTMIYDYTYEDYKAHGDSYDGCSRSDSYQISVTEKWLHLYSAQSVYGSIRNIDPYTLIVGSEDNSSVILIIIASSISILSITALSVLMVKKKKSVNK